MQVETEFISTYYERLPRAKTIQQRQQARLVSLFPLSRLAQCVDSCLPNAQTGSQCVQKITNDINKLHVLPTSKLSQLFEHPIYQANPKILVNDDNETFGQIRCHLHELTTESTTHNPLITHEQSSTIQFESRFESGNLAMVNRQSENEFDLLIQKDINTNSCTQWFFFLVRNNQQMGNIRFNLVNLTKKYSAYENGMKVCVFSMLHYMKQGKGWYRGCNNIRYCRNNISRQNANNSYFTLSFEHEFIQRNDEVYFAYSYPYTYSRLQKYLGTFEQRHSKIVHRRRLGETLSGNFVEMLTITNFEEKQKVKPIIFVTARVHPGQTVSSYVCEGFIDFLLSNSKEAEGLRNQFVFKVVPMMNPDGVVNGNYRCSLFGRDLNRLWKNPDKSMHPQNYLVKKMMTDSYGERLAYFDMHGHSKKRGVFVYGCRNRDNPFECREIPFLFHKNLKSFNYYSCNFNTSQVREGTGRITVWRDFRVAHSYTLESSFFGPSAKFRSNFGKTHYRQIGVGLVKVLFIYFYHKQIIRKSPCHKPQQLNDVLSELYTNNQLLAVGNNASEGSSSAQSLQQLQGKINTTSRAMFEHPLQSPRSKEMQRQSPKSKEMQRQSLKNKEMLLQSPLSKQMRSTFVARRTPQRQRDPHNISQDYYRPKRFQQSDRYTPFETTRLSQNEFCITKPSHLKIPSIKELKMENITHNSFRSHYENAKRHCQHISFIIDSPRGMPVVIDTTKKQTEVATRKQQEIVTRKQSEIINRKQPEIVTRNHSAYINKFQMTSIIFPSSLRREYTNYQRIRKDEVDFTWLFSGEAGIVKTKDAHQVREGCVYNRKIIDRIKNKRQIRSVPKRSPGLQERTLGLL